MVHVATLAGKIGIIVEVFITSQVNAQKNIT